VLRLSLPKRELLYVHVCCLSRTPARRHKAKTNRGLPVAGLAAKVLACLGTLFRQSDEACRGTFTKRWQPKVSHAAVAYGLPFGEKAIARSAVIR
jgi:hypothetical protein